MVTSASDDARSGELALTTTSTPNDVHSAAATLTTLINDQESQPWPLHVDENQQSLCVTTCSPDDRSQRNHKEKEAEGEVLAKKSDSRVPPKKRRKRAGHCKGAENASAAFHEKLRQMLSQEKLSDIASWLPNGKAFVILDRERFTKVVLPLFFDQTTKFDSFVRKLYRYGFRQTKFGCHPGYNNSNSCDADPMICYHKSFQRRSSLNASVPNIRPFFQGTMGVEPQRFGAGHCSPRGVASSGEHSVSPPGFIPPTAGNAAENHTVGAPRFVLDSAANVSIMSAAGNGLVNGHAWLFHHLINQKVSPGLTSSLPLHGWSASNVLPAPHVHPTHGKNTACPAVAGMSVAP